MDTPVTDTSLDTIEDTIPPEMIVFPVEFFSKGGSGITRCINDTAKPFSIRSGDAYPINFMEPAFVKSIEIKFTKAILGAEIEVSSYDTLSNKNISKKFNQASLSDTVIFQLNIVTTGASLHLPRGFFELFQRKTLEIVKISITGYIESDFQAIARSAERIENSKELAIAEISKRKSDLESLAQKIHSQEIAVNELEAMKNGELEEITESIKDATERNAEARQTLEALTREIQQAEIRRENIREQIVTTEASARAIDGEISKGKEQLTALAKSTSEAERKLNGLLNNANLFSEEFSSFAEHGARQARVFLLLSIVPLIIVSTLTLQLLSGAADLSVKYIKEPNLDLLTVFTTRIPYLLVCTSILAVCYSILKFLLNRISAIYAERLDFSKIGIIAKEVSTASASGLGLTHSQLLDARTYLKIEMLKSYLSGNIGTFTYPRLNGNIIEKMKEIQRSRTLPAQPQMKPDDNAAE